MKLLADESVDARIILRLRSAGIEVIAIQDIGPGLSDIEVLAYAHVIGLVLLTEDKDFGELIFRDQRPAIGAMLLRATTTTEAELDALADRIVKLLPDASGVFVTLDDKTARTRPLR